MIQKSKLIGYTILCASLVLYGFCIWAVLNQTNDSQSYAPVHQSAHYGQSSDAPLLGTTPKQLMSTSRSKTHTTPNHNSARMEKMATHSSAAPFTYRSSDAQTQHIDSGYGANNNGLWSNSQSNGSSQQGIHATATWNGQVSAVASSTLAYVEAPSGSLPGEIFAPQMRRGPGYEDGSGTNGPNIEHENAPIGDGLYILLLLIMLYFCRNMLYLRKN